MGIGPYSWVSWCSDAFVAGTGKTALMRNMLATVDEEAVVSTTINLNSYTDAPSLQPILEASLEKKSGKILF